MPEIHPGLSRGEYWIIGVFGAVTSFISILLHELAHSIVALKYGLKLFRYTLKPYKNMASNTSLARTLFWYIVDAELHQVFLNMWLATPTYGGIHTKPIVSRILRESSVSDSPIAVCEIDILNYACRLQNSTSIKIYHKIAHRQENAIVKYMIT